jgi:regulatory protein
MVLRKCGELLKSQDYSEQRLRMKLRTAGFPEDTVTMAVEAMKDAHYIDDRRYAENYVKYHLRDRSRRRIEQDLQERGIAEDIIEEVFQAITENAVEKTDTENGVSAADEAEIEQICKLLRKKQFDPAAAGWEESRRSWHFCIVKDIRRKTSAAAWNLYDYAIMIKTMSFYSESICLRGYREENCLSLILQHI